MRRNLIILALIAAACFHMPSALFGQRPKVCDNKNLKNAIQIIHRACDKLNCNFNTLRQLDRDVDMAALFAAFNEPDLKSVHLFFPENLSGITDVFDWNTTKRRQLGVLNYLNDPDNTNIYVIGRASNKGDEFNNRRLSRERMRSVMTFLEKELGVRCRSFYGGWFGEEIAQIKISDAHYLHVDPQDFRNDPLIINQSVHVFIFPCANEL